VLNEKEKKVLIFFTIAFCVGSVLLIFQNNKKKKVYQELLKEITLKSSATPIKIRGEKVDINNASYQELLSLPGIGESIAQRIIRYREKYGGFKNKRELLKIKGIGKKRLSQIESLIEIK